MSHDPNVMGGPSIVVGTPMPEEELKKIIRISEDFYTVFSNHVRLAMSEDDFRLFFGEIYPTATNELVVTEHLCIALSPQRAKAVLSALTQTIAGYEKLFGTIKPQTIIPTASPVEAPVHKHLDQGNK
jgi:hypothetical protein